jgi:CelD/BcsL family acetyltransferase involved in cellulose biosynthesis
MRIEQIGRFDRFLELKSEWNLLTPGAGLSLPALTHEWFSAWLQAFGKDIELAILALFDGNAGAGSVEKLVGVAPLRMVRSTYRGIRCTQLRFLYNRHGPRCCFLMRNGYADWTAVLMEEVLKLPGWDVAILENIPHESYLHVLCASMRDSKEHSTLLRRTMSSPFLKIEGSWEDFFNSRPRNLKRSLRSKEKKVSAAGKMTIEHFTDAASTISIMPVLIALGKKSWKARGGRAIGSQPESREFYSLLAEKFGRENRVSVWLMRVNGEPVAFEFHLVQDRQVQALRAEFDEKYRDLGVGSVLDKEIVKTLFETGFKEYDMGGEADFYKLRWTENVRNHSELLIFSKSALGRLLCTVEKGVVEPIKKLVNPRKE